MQNATVELLFYMVMIFCFLTVFEYERDQSGRLVFRGPTPLLSLKASSALIPCYLFNNPSAAAGISQESRTLIDATALTVIAAPLFVPFLSVPQIYARRLSTFAPVWLAITLLRVGVAYVLERFIEFLGAKIYFVGQALKVVGWFFFVPKGTPEGSDIPEGIQALLLIGLVARLGTIYRSRQHVLFGLLGSLVAPVVLSYEAQIYRDAKLPLHVLEFAPVQGFLLGLFFLFCTEYSLLVQARPFERE